MEGLGETARVGSISGGKWRTDEESNERKDQRNLSVGDVMLVYCEISGGETTVLWGKREKKGTGKP